MFSMIPPVGLPFDWRTVFPAKDESGKFARSLAQLLGGECTLTSSGKAALWLVLSAMQQEQPDRDEVIIPDYTCWTVPSAVVRAGLKVKPVDIEPHTLGLDPNCVQAAITGKTLAVIAPHLFGVPSRIDELELICKERQVFLIDDSAQAFGAKIGERPAGSFGDAGILSFGRGKNFTTGNGGAAVIRHEGVRKQAATIINAQMAPSGPSAVDKIQMIVYKSFFSRRLFWIPASLPFLRLGETVYDTAFDLSLLSPDRAGRGISMLAQYQSILEARRKVAAGYRERLAGAKGLNLTESTEGRLSADLRFPVILADKSRREQIHAEGKKFGISGMYPDTVSSVSQLAPWLVRSAEMPVARLVADQLITLPTHFGITLVDIDRISRFLMQVAA
jgi:dTDP-4-amino-4,6-dideoxygalactose transaminase